MDPADFVLRRFGARERDGVDLMVEVTLDVLDTYVAEGPAEARQRAGEAAAPR
jgi:peptidyl-tRNA hydrolase